MGRRNSQAAVSESVSVSASEPTVTEQAPVVVQGQASEIAIEGLAETLASKRDELRTLKAEAELADWEAKTSAKNPQYVPGSVRKATDEDKALLGVHCHGEVCEIVCLECGKTRVINRQDAFQSRYCKEHVKEGKKAAARERRAAKVADPAKAREQIAALEAKIAALKAKAEPEMAEVVGDLEPVDAAAAA